MSGEPISEFHLRATGSVFLGLGIYVLLGAAHEEATSLDDTLSTLIGAVAVAIGTPMVFGHNILGLVRR